MASVVTRRHENGELTHKVQFRLGGRRAAPWQAETFVVCRAAGGAEVRVAGRR